MRFIKYVIAALIGAGGTGLPGATAATVKWGENVPDAVDARLIEAPALVFPEDRIKSRDDGWALVSFVIGEDGRTSNIFVLKTSRKDTFAKEAYEAVKARVYEPAQVSGLNTSQFVAQELIVFENPDFRDGVSDDDRTEIERAFTYLLSDQLHFHQEQVTRMGMIKRRDLALHKYLEFFKGMKDSGASTTALRSRALGHFQTAIALADHGVEGLEPYDAYVMDAALQYSVILSLQTNKTTDGFDAYEALAGFHGNLPEGHSMTKTVDGIKAQLAGGAGTSLKGYATRPCEDCEPWKRRTWYHTLYSSSFQVENIRHWKEGETGRLDTIKLLCDYHTNEIPVTAPSGAWAVPDGSGTCTLQFFGASGTEFTLSEHPVNASQ